MSVGGLLTSIESDWARPGPDIATKLRLKRVVARLGLYCQICEGAHTTAMRHENDRVWSVITISRRTQYRVDLRKRTLP